MRSPKSARIDEHRACRERGISPAGRSAGMGWLGRHARCRNERGGGSDPMSSPSKARSRLAVRYFDDRILLTDSAAWAYFRLPTVSYEFTTAEEREALATNITIALAGIRMQDAEIHLRIAHRTYPAAEWARSLDETSDGGPGWRAYLEEMYAHVWAKDFWTKEVYLGGRLWPRGVRRPPSRSG